MTDEGRGADGSGTGACRAGEPPQDYTAAELAEVVQGCARALRQRTRAGGGPLPPHQGRALRLICEEGPVRPARLAERLHIAPRSLTDVLDALQEAGLVRREPDPRDRRAQVLTTTPAGEQMKLTVDRLRAQAAEEIFGGMAAGERSQVGRLLDAVLQAQRVAAAP